MYFCTEQVEPADWNNALNEYDLNSKFLNHKTTLKRKKIKWTLEISLRKHFRPTNTQKKTFWTIKLPTRKNVEPMKFQQENILNPQNIHKNLQNTNRKYIGPIKHPSEKELDPQRHGTKSTRHMMAHEPQDLAHLSIKLSQNVLLPSILLTVCFDFSASKGL